MEIEPSDFLRNTGNQDLPIGQFVIYGLRCVLARDLAGAWGDYGGIVAQINHLAVALYLSITDHPGIAVTYDRRARRMIRKISKTRSAKTDYFEWLSNPNKDVRADAIRDFDAKADAVMKNQEKDKVGKEKEKEQETKKKPGAGKDRQGKGDRRKRKWTADDWAEFRKNKLSPPAEATAAEAEKKKTKGKKKEVTK